MVYCLWSGPAVSPGPLGSWRWAGTRRSWPKGLWIAAKWILTESLWWTAGEVSTVAGDGELRAVGRR
jgi:hypothetical protein